MVTKIDSDGQSTMVRRSRGSSGSRAKCKAAAKPSDAAVATVMAATAPTVEVISALNRAVAYVIPHDGPGVMPLVDVVYAMAPARFKNELRLVREWGVWAVICDKDYADFMKGKPRPSGVRMTILR